MLLLLNIALATTPHVAAAQQQRQLLDLLACVQSASLWQPCINVELLVKAGLTAADNVSQQLAVPACVRNSRAPANIIVLAVHGMSIPLPVHKH
jgi:hypothetical protein